MAKKFYDGEITLQTDWGGDASTENLPVVGSRVQEVIKEGINSKVGYVGRVEKTGQGFYVLSRDEATFNAYLETITDENPFGDLTMDGINGRFDAPFNYKMNITLLNPENGYKSTLVGSTGNVIKFRAETLDNNNTPQGESVTITYKVKTEGGVESTYTAIYDGNIASQGIEYSLDGKLSSGVNSVTITAVGMNTGISAMRRITYRLIDMYFADRFDIAKRYQFTSDGTLAMNIGYDLKGVGKTKIVWYFDGNHYATDDIANLNPNLTNTSRSFYFTESANSWLTPGIHNIQMSMICKDSDSGEEFQTPIYYREFVVEKTPTVLKTPFIVRKLTFDNSKGFLTAGKNPTIYDAKQYENVTLEYAAYYNGKSSCNITSYIKYAGYTMEEVSSEDLPLVLDDFSNKQKQIVSLTKEGAAELILRAYYSEDEYFETVTNLEIKASDMNISTVEDSVVLYLNAFGRSNNASGKDVWEYRYTNVYGEEQVIKTKFSKNEYVVISTYDNEGNVIAPEGANESNTLSVNSIPESENEDYKYLLHKGLYYVWNREFDWSDTSGWSDNKLKLANGNAITIDYNPFSSDKLPTIKDQGATFEFEFETTNVYNDDAIICRICGNENFAPGIVISASGAELVISREVVTGDGENAGYTKKVSTKYKAEESNRISFVITPDSNDEGYRNRILSIYVNGELCGAYAYDNGTNFYNDSNISFRGSEEACVNISSIKIYERALSSNEILSNYIYYRNDANEKAKIYQRNDIMLDSNDETFDSDKLKSQLPVMMFYQIDVNQSIDDIHQEKKNKKLTRFFDVVYIDIQDPSKNFLVKNAYITPQGTSSMNYPVKNLRLYTGKKDKAGNYYSRLFVGPNIFKDGSPSNLNWDNINEESEIKDKKRRFAFKNGSIPVNCWCLKADFAESSSSHNTGTSRYWNNVLKNAGFSTKAQVKASKYAEEYPYDVRTTIDGFPIVVFYQSLDGSTPRFEGKYNFNNDKSTEDVFGFTGGIDIDDQEVKYFYIGNEMPVIHGEENEDTGEMEYTCSFEHDGYTETPNEDSPLYASKVLDNGTEDWYMLRGKALLDNPKMECWELLNSVNEIALFKTMIGFGPGDGNEKIGIVKDNGDFDEAFESRYPDCGEYYHYNSLKRFGEWLVSCRYLNIDNKTGLSVPFEASSLPTENYHKNSEGKLSICSLSKQTGSFVFNFPGKNFYQEVDYNSIASNIKNEGYQQVSIDSETLETIEFIEVETMPSLKVEGYEYIKYGDLFYTWMPSNVLVVDTLPSTHETSYDYVLVGSTYYVWANTYKFEDYHETQWVEDSAFNRALKFAVEKYDHIEMNKMAAYYIYLMRFGGVDQTVKNSMLTTEGPASDDPESKLPSLWYFINYDNDTILGVKNDGRLVFDPYITRETKDGTGYVYAGRESTLWNNLEADAQFMDKVTEVDNKLADGGADPLFSLSYSNALREYDNNQSDKWCERIYNKDAERKYIDTYVKGWTQKIEADNSETHVYEDYLYDVQGSRSAHRKWWLGRRFNVFDSRFCNTNFRNQLIKFRSTNLPSGSSFTIKSGEPIFYAWGHDNSVTEMTPTAIQPGDTYTFTTASAFNIGSYLELMGAANISTLDLRDCVGALTELDVTGCYSPSVGTKMKEILVGDNTRNDLINISNTSLKFSGLANASKLETIDMTNIQNAVSLDGLNTLLNIRNVYARGTSIANFTFADGATIEKIELPSAVETLSLTRSSLIGFENIIFEGNSYGKLASLTIDNCPKLMNNSDFVINWIGSKTDNQRANLSLNLQGINWSFNMNNYQNLFLLEKVGTAGMAQRNIRGNIEITARLDISDVIRLKSIFGEDCFKEGSKVYIKAPTGLYVNLPEVIWEGEKDVKCEITTVGTTLSGELQLSALVNEIVDGEVVQKIIGATDGIITMDETNLSKGYTIINVLESNNVYEHIVISAVYREPNGNELMQVASSLIQKRIYPESVELVTTKDSYNVKTPIDLGLVYSPEEINNDKLSGRGIFSVKWEMIEGSNNYENSLQLLNANSENAKIQAPNGFDGTVVVKATLTRNYDSLELCSAEKELEFTNPDTILTKFSNEPLYNIFVTHGIIREDETGFGKLTKTDAAMLTMADMISGNKSIFAGNTNLKSFIEFQYFSNTYMGQMPQDGVTNVALTPDGMFKGCSNLKEIAFSDNFKYTSTNMFNGCTNLEHIYGKQVSEENGIPVYTNLAFEHIGTGFANGCRKLKTCLLSSATKHIASGAFVNCENLGEFYVPTSPSLVIEYSKSTTPFQGCTNINFSGAEYGGVAEAKYQVKDGACYEINGDGTLSLLHMGKDTLITNIPSDKPVYALSYSMENRKEDDIVIPENVIFNGYRILERSIGNSITLTNSVENLTCDYLFSRTNYKEYNFVENETCIPVNCFNEVNNSNFTKYVVPESIKTIKKSAFYGALSLKEITLPSTLETVEPQTFWNTDVKDIIMNGANCPSIHVDDFFGVLLENIYVLPQYIEEYKNNLMYLIRPLIKPLYLFNEGYVRIIKDGEYLVCDENNIVTVGGINVEQRDDYYMYYQTDDIVEDLNVYLNGVSVGEISDLYTTVYLGDNSSLFSGDGYNFTKGVYDDTIKSDMEKNGWFYDSRFEGIRNKHIMTGNTELTIKLKDNSTVNSTTLIEYGQYADDSSSGYIKGSDNKTKIQKTGTLGYNNVENIETGDGTFIFGFVRGTQGRPDGINGIVINKIGNCIYSDPELPNAVSYRRDIKPTVKLVTLSLSAIKDIPDNVYVTVTDGIAHTYRKFWNGEPLTFVLPIGYDFKAYASSFISNGKLYTTNEIFIDEENINLMYNTKTGIEIKNNILSYYNGDTDWFVCLDNNKKSWGTTGVSIKDVETNEIFTSDTDGLSNTKKVAMLDAKSICAEALKFDEFEKGVVGYIPSYIELELFSSYLTEINAFLKSKRKSSLSLSDVWTSESFDSNNAWNSNGEYVQKNTVLKYFIFGKRITL